MGAMSGGKHDHSAAYHKPSASKPISKVGVVIIVVVLLASAGGLLVSTMPQQQTTVSKQTMPTMGGPVTAAVKPTPVIDQAAFDKAYAAGTKAYQKGNLQEAKTQFTAAIKANAGSADAYQARATVEKILGQTQLANQDFAYADSLRGK